MTSTSLYAEIPEYITKPDSSYEWTISQSRTPEPSDGAYKIEMVSQTWRDIRWTHDLMIVLPKDAPKDLPLLLFVTGGDGKWKYASIGAKLATRSNAAIAVLFNMPNQPLFKDLTEDDLIAYTFDRFLETGEKNWPLLLPMTKATIRSIDTLSEFLGSRTGHTISHLVVGGGSKRGWTSWLTGAMDDRVDGIIPMVIDVLNFPLQLQNQVDAWGTFSHKIDEYIKRDLHIEIQSDNGRELVQMVDPYFYRDQLTMPKLIISGTNDPYWPLNSVNLFYDQLKGPKFREYVINAGHKLKHGAFPMIGLIEKFLQYVQGTISFPAFDTSIERTSDQQWKFNLRSRSGPSPRKVILWYATSDSKDFRNSSWSRKFLVRNQKDLQKTFTIPASNYVGFVAKLYYTIKGQTFSLSSRTYRLDNQFSEPTNDNK